MLLRLPEIDHTKLFLLNEKHRSFLTTGKGKLYEVPRYAEIIVWAIPIVGIIMGIQLLISELNRRTLYEDLMQTGVTTQAEITSHRTDEGNRTNYFITYRFNGSSTDHTSQIYTNEENVSRASYEKVKDGDSIAILYLPPRSTYFLL